MMFERLSRNWVYGAFLAAFPILGLLWLLAHDQPETLRLTLLMLPLYMIHQYEEHDDDRFRLFFNRTVGGGREALTPLAVLVINTIGVWGTIVGAAFASAWVAPGLGLIAVWLAVLNAIVHIAHALL
jgi:hypothetical protein